MTEKEQVPVKKRIEWGVSAWEQGDFQAALESFQTVLAENPSFPDVHNKAGLCLAMLGDPKGALEAFDRALVISETYAEAHLNRAIVLQELGRFEEARRHLIRADELDHQDSLEFPSDVGHKIAIAHAQLGDLYMVADRPEKAADEYRRALEVRARFLDIRSKYAEALLGMEQWDEAREQLQIILDNNPDFTTARLRLGLVLFRNGDEEGAREQWERCLADDPRDMRAKAYLASMTGGGGAVP
jgi:tetratricopeptide (TPR) repeat protein